VSDLIRTNRLLIEDTLEHTKRMRFGGGHQSLVRLPNKPASAEADRPVLEARR